MWFKLEKATPEYERHLNLLGRMMAVAEHIEHCADVVLRSVMKPDDSFADWAGENRFSKLVDGLLPASPPCSP